MTFEDAREHQVTARLHQIDQHGCQELERTGQDVGDHHLSWRRSRRIGTLHHDRHLIARRVVPGGDQGLRVNINADHLARTQLGRGNRKNARTAPIVDDPCAGGHGALEPLEAQPRRRMTARAEGQARVQHDGDALAV